MMMLMMEVVITLIMKVLAMNGEHMDQMMKTTMIIHMKDLEVAMKSPHLHGSTGLQNLQNNLHQSHLDLQSDLQWKVILRQKKSNLVECLDVLEDQVQGKFLTMVIWFYYL